jgi:hypothetical protein
MPIILAAIGHVVRWLLAGLLGRLALAVIVQGVIVAIALFYGGEMASWATGKMFEFVRNSQFFERLMLALGGLGDLPANTLQFLACIGAHEVLVALISGQISGIGLAVICRKLL